jgi:hypothetical protein
MARRYINPNRPVQPHVPEQMLAGARASAEAAAAAVREAELADPTTPGWDSGLAAAETAARAAAKRLELLEQARAAQLERAGKRDAAARAAAQDLAAITAGLSASRDQVAAAAADHLRALAALAVAVDSHNSLLAGHRAALAAAGLRVRDDLVPEGAEHAEGTLEAPGLRAGGVDWLPVPLQGAVDHAMRQVFTDPQTQMTRFRWRGHETGERPDGLRLPALADVGAALPAVPAVPVPRSAPLSAVLAAQEDTAADTSPRRGRVVA